MFKLAVFFALVAAAFAAPQYLLGPSLASPYVPSISRLAYNAPSLAYGAQLSYAAGPALNYAAAPALSYAAAPAVSYAAPAPYAYQTAPQVTLSAEPVEQHGYRIAY